MPADGSATENLIKDAAKKIFLVEGKIHATTQDIAKALGLPRTSIHYYFRTRDALFKHVFNEALMELTEQLVGLVNADLPFLDKLDKYIDVWLRHAMMYPYLDTFVVTEIINRNYVLVDKNANQNMNELLRQVGAAMDEGIIKKMDPRQFVINLFSLLRYPSVTAPLYIGLFGLDDSGYQSLLNERKKAITMVLFSK